MSDRILLVIILFLSGFIHIWNVAGFPPQDADEGVYVRKALHFSEGLGPKDPLSPYYNPYFGQIFLGALFKLVGYPELFNPSFSLGSIVTLYGIPRVLMGILAVFDTFLLYRICQILYNKNVAILASLFFAVMPITWLLRMVYLDTILLPFLLCSILFAVSITKRENMSEINLHKNSLLVILSGVFLGLAIFTKIPAFTMIVLVGYIVYDRSKNKKNIAMWIIPVILIPLLWPVHASYLGELDKWVDGVTHQAIERDANHGLLYALNQFYLIDPVFLFIGIGSIVFIAVIKRDLQPVLWVSPLILFFYLIHYASVFHFIMVVPAFCITVSVTIDHIGKKIRKKMILRNKDVSHVISRCVSNLPLIVFSFICIFGFISTTTLITTNTASFQQEAAAFVAHSIGSNTKLYGVSGGNDVTLVTNSIYYWLFKYIFHFERVYHKINVTGLESAVPERVILMIDSDLKKDLAIGGNLSKYSSTTKSYLSLTDNIIGTRWKSEGPKPLIEGDLSGTKFLCTVGIAWYRGDGRSYTFKIQTSNDGSSFKDAFYGKSSGTTVEPEKYPIGSYARYVRILINGNNVNNISSVTQINIYGKQSNSSNNSSCNSLKIGGLTTDNDERYENVFLSKRKNVLRMIYYATHSMVVFNGSAANYDLNLFPYTGMLYDPGGSYVDVRDNFFLH